ncbi:MAG: hypothetical protein ABWY36_07260 [Leifsonia sp.]
MPVPKAIRLRREAWGFGAGSICFLLGALPFYQEAVGVVATDVTFFIGALLFTAGAFIQLALSGRKPPRSGASRPDLFDWWATAVQFAGTLFFNLSTTQALTAALGSGTHTGWRPDAIGSILFLVSSGLGLAATLERSALWDPEARAWRCTWFNMFGSVFFGISAIGAYVVPTTNDPASLFWANLGTALGAVCFLAAALLSRPGRAAVRAARQRPVPGV